MHVIEVIPLTRGSVIESLTYYSSHSYPVGTIIDVPIRNQTKRSVVIGIKPVSVTKTAVRTATFTLKKLPEQTKSSTLPPAIIETAKRLAKTTPATIGSLLFALMPPEVREGDVTLESNLPCIGTYEVPQVAVLQASLEERLRTYRSRVREAFAHRGSVLFVVPTSRDIDMVAEALGGGIENRIVTFSPLHTKKKMLAAYEALHDYSKAKLIITTASHAFVDRHDIISIVIEQSRSRYYKSKVRPYIDTKDALITLARVTGRNVLLGDLLPNAEDEYKRREDIYVTEGETPKRMQLPGKLVIAEQKIDRTANDSWRLFSKECAHTIAETHKTRGRTFIYAARRGMSPLVTCVDCGHVFRCPDTGAPYSLHKTGSGDNEQRWFVAAASGRRLKAPDTCTECGSWRLKERGVGIQHIYAELRAQFPDIPVILFDHTTATTHRKAIRLMAEFNDTKGAILLGSAMSLPYLTKNISLSVITSLEALRANPAWRAEEELLGQLLRLREVSNDAVCIQTRAEPDELLDYAKNGTVEAFYNEELELRSQLKYPPYAAFIHLTLQGTDEQLTETQKEIEIILEKYSPKFYPAALFSKKKTVFGLLRIKKADWPNEDLVARLRSLPPSVRIEVNPERLT